MLHTQVAGQLLRGELDLLLRGEAVSAARFALRQHP